MKTLLHFLSILIFILPAYAQEVPLESTEGSTEAPVSEMDAIETEEEEEKDLEFKTGVISSMGQIKKSGAVDTSALDGVPGEEQPAVSGSVRKLKRGRCSAFIKNNSEKSAYSVRYKVQGFNERGSSVFNRNFSSRLSAGESDSHEFACRDGLNMRLVVTSGKKLGQ